MLHYTLTVLASDSNTRVMKHNNTILINTGNVHSNSRQLMYKHTVTTTQKLHTNESILCNNVTAQDRTQNLCTHKILNITM